MNNSKNCIIVNLCSICNSTVKYKIEEEEIYMKCEKRTLKKTSFRIAICILYFALNMMAWSI